MRPLHAWLAVVCACAAAPASAQTYRFRSYTVNEGLASNSVYSVMQDHVGYLWFATDAGASRYDGAGFRSLGVADGLADMSVRAIVEDAQGRLYLATKGGLSVWDGAHFTRFGRAQGLADDELRCALLARDGSLWLGTSSGLTRLMGGRFVNYGAEHGLPPGPVWTLHEDRQRTLLVGIRGGGLVRRVGERFEPVPEGPRRGTAAEDVFDIEEGRDGELWIATDGGLGLLRDGRLRLFTEADGLPSHRISSLLTDSLGRLWIGTFGGGVARRETNGFTVFDRRSGLPDDYVTALASDAEGDIWCASLWHGAFRLLDEQFVNYGSESGVGGRLVRGLAQAPNGTLYFSSVEGGLVGRDPAGRVRRYGRADGLPDDQVWSVLVDRRGRLWAAGHAGASVLEGGRFRHLGLERLGARDRIDALGEDARGWIWLGSSSARSPGVSAWDGERVRHFGRQDGLVHNQVNGFLTSHDGTLWICTEGGLGRFDGRSFASLGTGDGLPARRVLTAHEDARGRLWFGTAGGLALYDGRRFRVFRKADGLPSDVVLAITSRDDELWLGTPAGLSVFDGRSFRNYGTPHGLASQQISQGSALLARDGSLWFGTAAGALQRRPVRGPGPALAPRLALTRVVTARRELDPAADLELAPDETTLTFHYAGLAFRDEAAVRYSSRLEGSESDWSEERAERSIRFTNLPPGRYRFLVRARVGAGPWGAPAALALRLPAPWWATTAFRALLGLSALSLAAAGVSLRVRAVRRAQERRHAQRLQAQQELLDAVRVINADLDLDGVLQRIALEAAELVRAEPSGIGRVRDGGVVFRRCFANGGFEDCDRREALGQGLAGGVAGDGRSRIAQPGAERAAVAIRDRAGAVVGVLEVRRPPARAPFSDDDLALLELLSHQAAVAIENAALYGDLQEQRVLLSESVWAMEELWKNEQRMREQVQELDRLKTNFLIVTAHEMRTPLTILKGHHDALLSGALGEPPASQRRFLEVCQRTADRMAGAFADILEMLQVEERRLRLRRSRVALGPLVAAALEGVKVFLDLRKQCATLAIEPGLPEVLADADRLHLVVTNLLENAIRFTPDAGRIEVRVAREGAAEVRLSVHDDGIGIATAELERIFDKFYTSMDSLHHKSGTYQFKTRGAGLGLAIARALVEAHGGRIWAESPGPDRGSSFHVVLPIELKGLEEPPA